MYREKIINIKTNQETWRDYTDNEIAEVEKEKTKAKNLAFEQEVKAEARAAAQAKLAALGLTVEDLQALGL
jgi:uncharacterized protein YqfA (UPF0365 family)